MSVARRVWRPQRIVASVGIRYDIPIHRGAFVWPDHGPTPCAKPHGFLYAYFVPREHLRLWKQEASVTGRRPSSDAKYARPWRVVEPTSTIEFDPGWYTSLRPLGPISGREAGRFASANVLLTGTFAECAAFMLDREWDDPRVVEGT